MAEKRYRQIYHILKAGIQQGDYAVGTYLPSEHELCKTYTITRTTARRALEELLREGFIEKEHGKGSRVKERRQALGLLTVKGFSEAVGENVQTTFLREPQRCTWPATLPFPASPAELASDCLYFERLRGVGEVPVMRECNWFSGRALPDFLDTPFVEGSFFKTLSRQYQIEITGSEQALRASLADTETAHLLRMQARAPVLEIALKFSSSHPHLTIYSRLYCNTDTYPIGNQYHLRA